MANDKLNKYENSLIREIMKGKSQRQAFKDSLYKSDVITDELIDIKASTILARDKVKERLEELRERVKNKLDEEVAIEVADVLLQIKSLLETDITDIAEIVTVPTVERYKGKIVTDSVGNPVVNYEQIIRIKDTEDMSPAALRSISEIGYDKHGRLKVKRYDKNKTIDQAGKYLKMFTEKLEISGEVKNTVTIVEDI